MTGEHENEIDMDRLDMDLFELGELGLPDGFDTRLKSFSEMTAAIADLPVGDDEEPGHSGDQVAAHDELSEDAFELGLGFLDQGQLDRAERWLVRAARYGHSQARDKLADLMELRAALADIKLDLAWSPWKMLPKASTLTDQPFAETESLTQAHESAQAIIDDAHRRAESIIALAKLRAQSTASSGPDPVGARQPLAKLWSAYSHVRTDDRWAPLLLIHGVGAVGSGPSVDHFRCGNLAWRMNVLMVDACHSRRVSVPPHRNRLWEDLAATVITTGNRPRERRGQDELLQLYEFAGGNVDELLRTAGWHVGRSAYSHQTPSPHPEISARHQIFTKELVQRLSAEGIGAELCDLVTAAASRLMGPAGWLAQSDGLVIPSDLHAEPVSASAGRR